MESETLDMGGLLYHLLFIMKETKFQIKRLLVNHLLEEMIVYRFVCVYLTPKPKLFHLFLILSNHFKGFIHTLSVQKCFKAAFKNTQYKVKLNK